MAYTDVPQTAAHHDANAYYVPHGSHWPLVGSVGLFCTVCGAANWMNGTAESSPTTTHVRIGVCSLGLTFDSDFENGS